MTLNRDDEDSIELCLAHVNHCIQYGENLEPSGDLESELFTSAQCFVVELSVLFVFSRFACSTKTCDANQLQDNTKGISMRSE